jgi:hypothetical protein
VSEINTKLSTSLLNKRAFPEAYQWANYSNFLSHPMSFFYKYYETTVQEYLYYI